MDRVDYLNVVEVEAAIARLRETYPQLCTLLPLPNKTYEQRTCQALRISTSHGGSRDALMVVAGQHGCEWGTSDAAVSFATDLLAVYTDATGATGIGYGDKFFAKEALKAFLDTRDVVVFPQVNPDGRAYSMAHDELRVAGWRKNRRLLSGRGDSGTYGVDINRNYETAWDFERLFFANQAYVSAVPEEDEYHGTEAFSEAESKNVKALLDDHPTTRWLVDVHGAAQSIQCNWGIDQTQSDVAGQNFRNSDWDHKRGKRADAYGEYRVGSHAQLGRDLAQRVSNAVFAVRGKRWPAGACFDTLYAVSGALIDYAYARNLPESSPPPIQAFVIEHAGKYHPPWPEMSGVVDEICAALMEFCVAVT